MQDCLSKKRKKHAHDKVAAAEPEFVPCARCTTFFASREKMLLARITELEQVVLSLQGSLSTSTGAEQHIDEGMPEIDAMSVPLEEIDSMTAVCEAEQSEAVAAEVSDCVKASGGGTVSGGPPRVGSLPPMDSLEMALGALGLSTEGLTSVEVAALTGTAVPRDARPAPEGETAL